MERNEYFEQMLTDSENGKRDFTRGEAKACRCYRDSREAGCNYFEVRRLPWYDEVKDFVDALRKAGVKEVIVTDHSSGLMSGLFDLRENGCAIRDLEIVKRGNGIDCDAEGIMVSVN